MGSLYIFRGEWLSKFLYSLEYVLSLYSLADIAGSMTLLR